MQLRSEKEWYLSASSDSGSDRFDVGLILFKAFHVDQSALIWAMAAADAHPTSDITEPDRVEQKLCVRPGQQAKILGLGRTERLVDDEHTPSPPTHPKEFADRGEVPQHMMERLAYYHRVETLILEGKTLPVSADPSRRNPPLPRSLSAIRRELGPDVQAHHPPAKWREERELGHRASDDQDVILRQVSTRCREERSGIAFHEGIPLDMHLHGDLPHVEEDLAFDLVRLLHPILVAEQENRQAAEDRKCTTARRAVERSCHIVYPTVSQARQAEGVTSLR